jgi:hypothetical protein
MPGFLFEKLVGATRFERAATRTPSECATRLRHAPIHPPGKRRLLDLAQYFSESFLDKTYRIGRIKTVFRLAFGNLSLARGECSFSEPLPDALYGVSLLI